MAVKQVRVALVGAGNIGRAFLQLMLDKAELLRQRHGFEMTLVGLADRSGAALDPAGLRPADILSLKAAGRGAAALPAHGQPGMPPDELVRRCGADLLLEASPTNIVDGQPGLRTIETALGLKMHVVSANKGPLVLAYPHLMALARQQGVALKHSAAVAGSCPTVNIGQRDLLGCQVARLEGIFNMTTNTILCRMAEKGLSFDVALAQAQAEGIAEADPTLDIDGWDAANKLVILANSVLGLPVTLADVEVEGIRGVRIEALQRAQAEGSAIKLLATAAQAGDGYKLAVRPTTIPLTHPLARLTADQMGIIYYTDVQGTIAAVAGQQGVLTTAGAMLRDVVAICG